jgi:exodeoxyribonuclease VII large subunit
MENVELSPVELVALLNQTLDYAYPSVTVVGELANFRISRNKWVYFDLKDDEASVKFFGTIYSLPGPLEDGMKLAVTARPHIHDLYGFSMQVSRMHPVGEGTIKKSADLLMKKLEAEGLFAPERKRLLPYPPKRIGLITSTQSAAYADFIKIINARYAGLEIVVHDAQVQGDQAVVDIVQAIHYFNNLPELVEVLVITRGGGSADDLAAFGHEQLVRTVASSRIPTLVAIGHEIDVSLAELAADARASTPSNAAELLVPDKKELYAALQHKADMLQRYATVMLETIAARTRHAADMLQLHVQKQLSDYTEKLAAKTSLLDALSPYAALQRGYAIVRKDAQVIKSVGVLTAGDIVTLQFSDGETKARVE